MRGVSAYALAVGLLAAELVQRARAGDGRQDGGVNGRALGGLARFLCAEAQRPLADSDANDATNTDVTSLAELLRRLERALSDAQVFRTLAGALVAALAAVDAPDSVEDALDRVAESLEPLEEQAAGADVSAALARRSVLGVFVRRLLLAAGRLLFDGLSRLFDDVRCYVQRFREDCGLEHRAPDAWRGQELPLSPVRPASAASASFLSPSLTATWPQLGDASDSATISEDAGGATVWTSEQLGVVLDDAVQRISRGQAGDAGDGEPAPGSVRVARELAARGDAGDRDALYVKYLDRLHGRDYQGALHALHHYHDVVPADHVRERAALSGVQLGADAQPSGVASASVSHFRGAGVQYAALNLAGLHIAFDHLDAAQESLLEAVRVAQHHGDHVCVAFALLWMVQIARRLGKPKLDVLPLVRNCLERAKELQLPTLRVLAALADAEVQLASGSPESEAPQGTAFSAQLLHHVLVAQAPGPRPAEIWTRLEQSTEDAVALFVAASSSGGQGSGTNGGRAGAAMLQLAQQQQQAAAAGGAERHSRGMTWMRSGDAVLDAMWQMRGSVHLSSALAWRMFGNRPLEQALDRMYAACYQDVASLEEVTSAVSRMALHSLSDGVKIGADCGAGANVYLRSLQFVMDAVEQLSSQSAQRQWMRQASFQRVVHHLLFLLALRRGEFPLASAHLDVVQSLSPEEKNLPAHVEVQLSRAVLLSETGDCERSLSLLKALEVTCTRLELVYLLAHVLLVTTKVQLRWSSPHASGSALPPLLKCIDVCKQHHYDLLRSEADLVMAEILLGMGRAQKAQALVVDEMPIVMEHGTVHLRGEARLVLAKARLADLPRSGSEGGGLKVVEDVLALLEGSQDMFASCQDVRRLAEVNYLTALVYNHALESRTAQINGIDTRAMEERREDASKRFVKYQQKLNRARLTTLEPTVCFDSVEGIRDVLQRRSHGL